MKVKRRQTQTEPESPLSRDEYFAERQLLIGARQRAYQRAEQLVVGGATGALLLSITFLEKLAPKPVVEKASLLVAAWVALLIALSASLLGQYASARAFDREISCLEAQVHCEPVPSNEWRRLNVWCAASSAVLLVIGISILAVFAYLNAPFALK